jgi:nitrate reductase gamma subunit
MTWYILLTYISLGLCLTAYCYQLIRIILLGAPIEYSKPIGSEKSGISYSFTGAMSPRKKESAYLHLPTYTAGMIYHLGTFAAIALFFLILLNVKLHEYLNIILIAFLILSALCGLAILIKRMVKKELRFLSNPDDYISNILVSLFHIATAYYLFKCSPFYFVLVSLLLLYLPVGKLKHSLYFFAARYHLGFFYGRRGVWPPNK